MKYTIRDAGISPKETKKNSNIPIPELVNMNGRIKEQPEEINCVFEVAIITRHVRERLYPLKRPFSSLYSP